MFSQVLRLKILNALKLVESCAYELCLCKLHLQEIVIFRSLGL